MHQVPLTSICEWPIKDYTLKKMAIEMFNKSVKTAQHTRNIQYYTCQACISIITVTWNYDCSISSQLVCLCFQTKVENINHLTAIIIQKRSVKPFGDNKIFGLSSIELLNVCKQRVRRYKVQVTLYA